jgi:hypothetical protein
MKIINLSVCVIFASVMVSCSKAKSTAASSSSGLAGAAVFYNGATVAKAADKQQRNMMEQRDASYTWTTSDWYLAPNTMTVTVVSIAFIQSGETTGTAISLDNCSVTYNQSQASLAQLANCKFNIPAGTYIGVTITWNTMFQMVINDSTHGIYTDPTQTNLLNTVAPSGGGQSVNITDSNASGSTTASETTMFPVAQTYDSSNLPELAIVFDPTHWMIARTDGTSFTTSIRMSGNPPIVASVDGMGKVMIFNNVASLGNIQPSSNLIELKVFYSTATTPWAVLASEDPCGSHLFNAWAGSTVGVDCTANGGSCFGNGGFLGLDSNNILSWALPAGNSWTYSIWSNVLSLPIPSNPTVGSTTSTLSYVCLNGTATAPVPAGGASTYTTAPNLTSLGTVATQSLTLMAD